MANRAENDRRYRERIKAERKQFAQLQKEKREWEAEKKMIYTILQTGVNDLIDKHNDTLKYVFDEEDEIDRDMIESLSVAFIQLPDIEITNEAVTNVEDTQGDDEKETSQEPLEEKEGKNEPDENTQSDDEAPDDPIENAAPDDEESDGVTEDEDYDEDYDIRQEVAGNKHIPPDILARLGMDEDWNDEDEINERMGRGGSMTCPTGTPQTALTHDCL